MRVAVLILAATVLLGACSDGSDPGAVVEGTEIARTTTTTIPPAPHLESTSTIPVELVPPVEISRSDTVGKTAPVKLSWQGQRFDIGVIKRVAAAAGGWVLAFDREEVVDARGTRSGKELTADPIDGAARPPVVRDSSRAILLFNVSADAQVTVITPDCASGTIPTEVAETVPDLATYGVGGNVIDSLSFDSTGQVTTIRMTHSC